MIRIELPYHLRTLAQITGEVTLELDGTATLGAVLDALEDRYPMLRGTIRDQVTHERRPFLRFYACEQTCRSSRPTRRCPRPSPRARSRCL